MKTDIIVVSSTGKQMEAALQEVDKVADYKHLSRKSAVQLRLLTEEMMGMMRAITGETEGQFWMEDDDGVYQLHLIVETSMNSQKRSQLLAASTSGKNESARGLMGHILDFFDRGADEDVASFNSTLLMPEMADHGMSSTYDLEWSMMHYHDALYQRVQSEDRSVYDAWDELEKSVVAHVADEIKVRIRGRDAEMIIYKKLV